MQRTSPRDGSRSPNALAKTLFGVALALTLVLSLQSSASAHAVVTDIVPEADAVLDQAPARISVTFNEPISATGNGVRLFDPSSHEIRGLDVRVENSVLSADVPKLDDIGSYTVSWKVVSADGHLITGAYLFSIGKATMTEPIEVADSGVPLAPRIGKGVGAVAGWAGLVMLLAVAGFAARSRFMRRYMTFALGLVVAGALLSVLASLFSVDGTVGDAFRVTFDTSSGKATMASLAVAVLVAAIIAKRIRGTDRLGDSDRRLIIGLGLVATLVMSLQGHALGLSPLPLSAAMTVLHILAAVIWLSGLVWIERRTRVATVDELRADVSTRSIYAMVSVSVLGISGLVLFLVRMPINELISSGYGLLGSAKIILLAMALGLAWQNRSTMKQIEPIETETDDAALARSHQDSSDLRRFKSTLRFETIVVSLALVLGAVLAQTPPPGLDQASGGYFGAKAAFGEGKVELTIDPGKRGVNEIHVTAVGSDGRLMADVEDLKLSFSLPEKEFGPLVPTLQIISAGHSYSFARIPFGGDWTVTVSATVNRFEELTAQFEVPIGK